MSDLQILDHAATGSTSVFGIGAEERMRENALRAHFARFWQSAGPDLRYTYNDFIAATPLADGVGFVAVDMPSGRGWLVQPTTSEPGQAILYLHGGGYQLGSAAAYRGFVSQIVQRTQVPALVIDYPLAPEATLPAAPDAALAAWRWLVEQGYTRIAVVGDSAGGGLALVTLARLTHQASGPAPVAGAVFSPWTDLAFTGASMTDPSIEDPLIGHDYLRDCARKYLGDYDATDPLASPLYGSLLGMPPLLVQVGRDERLLDDARQYTERAAASGVHVQLEIWEGMHHVFQLDVAHLESSRRALDRAARFLRDAFDHA
ncbi:alpha/beta hydrolase [Bordetella genomosp. 13]|uniref:alpha/beta hydrolase n=1 Tax=Bordetella genomosp. 13 TaxID=463040 RepID=UPI0011A5F4F9|nr:alpha/beta hydrolase [Bordetella genomosp. 13]